MNTCVVRTVDTVMLLNGAFNSLLPLCGNNALEQEPCGMLCTYTSLSYNVATLSVMC